MKSSDDVKHSIAESFKCPIGYLSKIQSDQDNEDGPTQDVLLFCNKDWMQKLVKERSIPDSFPTHPDISEAEVEALLADRQVNLPGWCLYLLKIITKTLKSLGSETFY